MFPFSSKYFALGRIFGVIGLVIFLWGALMLQSQIRFLQRAVETTGEVIQLAEEARNRRASAYSTTYAPIVDFYTVDNKKVTFYSKVFSYPPRYVVGDKVTIKYDPQTPQRADIATDGEMWYSSIALISFGLLFFFIGFVMRNYMKSKTHLRRVKVKQEIWAMLKNGVEEIKKARKK